MRQITLTQSLCAINQIASDAALVLLVCCWCAAAVAVGQLQLGKRLKGCRQQCQLSAICTVARCCCSSFGNRLGNRLIVEAVAAGAAAGEGEGAAAASPCHALAYITHIRIIQSNPRCAAAPPSSLSASSLLERRDVSCCCWQHVALLLAQLLVSGSNT